jgi:hypothetical protein
MYPNPDKQAAACGFSLNMFTQHSHVAAYAPVFSGVCYASSIPPVYLPQTRTISESFTCAKMERSQVCNYTVGEIAPELPIKKLRIDGSDSSTKALKNYRSSNASRISIKYRFCKTGIIFFKRESELLVNKNVCR